MKFSRQREVILQTLQENVVHPNADYIYQKVRQKLPNISLATVYRNLKQLSEQGVIRSIEGLDDSVHFDHNTGKHHHFICTRCKKIFDIDDSVTAGLDAKILETYGACVETSDFTFKGLCEDCRRN